MSTPYSPQSIPSMLTVTFWFIPSILCIVSKFAKISMKNWWTWSALESTNSDVIIVLFFESTFSFQCSYHPGWQQNRSSCGQASDTRTRQKSCRRNEGCISWDFCQGEPKCRRYLPTCHCSDGKYWRWWRWRRREEVYCHVIPKFKQRRNRFPRHHIFGNKFKYVF